MTDNLSMKKLDETTRLLAGCLGGDAEQLDRAAAWPGLPDAARRAGLSALILDAFNRTGVCVPIETTQALREHASRIAAHNVHLRHVLRPIIRAFDRAGVPLMLLKGAALNLIHRNGMDLRPMSDIDAMIRRCHVAEADGLLRRTGFRPGRDLVRPGFFPTYYGETEYRSEPPASVRIDLHVRPFRPLRYVRTVPDEALWDGAQAVTVDDSRVLIPGPEDMLLHLAGHAAIHGAPRLLWLFDIKRFVDASGSRIHWERVVERARRWRVSHPVCAGLAQAEAVFGHVIPPSAMNALRAPRVGLADRLALWEAPHDAAHPVRHVLVDVLCTPGRRYRLGYLRAMLFPDRAHLGLLYRWRHPGWIPCAHAYRWSRAVVRALRPPWVLHG
jgi:hypothetical protein